jgi:hypothetical protein
LLGFDRCRAQRASFGRHAHERIATDRGAGAKDQGAGDELARPKGAQTGEGQEPERRFEVLDLGCLHVIDRQ